MKFNELCEKRQKEELEKLLDNQYIVEVYKWEHQQNNQISFDQEWIKDYVCRTDWNFDGIN